MTIIIICQPSTAILWRSDIVIVPIVFAPLPNIATHVIVGLKRQIKIKSSIIVKE
ncbi:unknown protein [Microcystis aeruginosa NIES-843]|uniref:Uncharacterized protein n=1 Tax=Microcystis aeruginosa (strain NIES-843 / IAM M-2473) TaxID=449447 RepID=B0JSH6_MICAN|nr:unknown protein [Microcystis aeruginosa NIES-843]